MKKNSSIQITIPNPCHQNWQDMEPRTNGRHCDHCDKTVTDFTRFTDAQLLDYFAHHKGKTCGRFTAWQVDRVLQVPPQPHSRLYRMFIALGLTLVFTQVPEVRARVLAPVGVVAQQSQSEDSSDTTGINGIVFDEHGDPVIGAIVQVFQNGENKKGAATDIDGNFSIIGLAPGKYEVRVYFVGYNTSITQDVVVKADVMSSCNANLKVTNEGLTGEIVIIQYREGTPYNDAFGRDIYIKRETNR